MSKILSVVILALAAAIVAKGDEQLSAVISSNPNTNSSLNTEIYINLNRQQYEKNLQEYDLQMETFKQSYAASLNTINIRLEMLTDTLNQNDAKLNPLLTLSDLSKSCVNKYRSSIPSQAATSTKVNSCINTANGKLNSLLSAPLSTKNYLDSYYKNTFEKGITNCQTKFSYLPLNYTLCVTNVVSDANAYTFNNQKTFATQMDAAQCSGNANIKQALDCSYNVEKDTLSAVAVANTLIEKCLLRQDECKQCNSTYFCSEVAYIKRSEVNYYERTMANPFYGRNNVKECLMLSIV
ncbi:uncharacterized protein ACRADG_009312 [Cochliomyia hominivorax]